jgi:hypothetical protein
VSWYQRLFDPVVFDPRLLKIVQEAFDRAWKPYEDEFGTDLIARDAARDALAKAVIELAQRGEADAEKLRRHGAHELMRFRNPQAPLSA